MSKKKYTIFAKGYNKAICQPLCTVSILRMDYEVINECPLFRTKPKGLNEAFKAMCNFRWIN